MNEKTEHNQYTLLVKQYQAGDKSALKKLIKLFHPRLSRTICYYTKSGVPVDDLAQDCWLSIIKQLPDLKLKINFEVWALGIAHHKAVDWIRKQQRSRNQSQAIETQTHIENTAEARPIDREEKLERLQVGIRKLPPSQQVILNMFYLENLSLKEISKVLDIAEGTVKSRLFYARENLKKIIS
ncbi:MAG: RNA polymerase sigma factor [Balneolaceae bacterium]|nr:RNA polymerase sigma factor [Balneolaceae bacterium]